MRLLLIAGGLAIAFIVTGVVLATRLSLSEADQVASVGSFVLALIALAVTAVTALRRRSSADSPGPASAPQARSGVRVGKVTAESVQIGDNTTANITKNYGPGRSERPQPKLTPTGRGETEFERPPRRPSRARGLDGD
jgi:hypothetical protein